MLAVSYIWVPKQRQLGWKGVAMDFAGRLAALLPEPLLPIPPIAH